MNILVLRSYGDYVILLNCVQGSTIQIPVQLIVSQHLKALHEALNINIPSNFNIQFHDFKIKRGILGLFTNKFLFTISTLRELFTIKKILKTQNISKVVIEQNKRIGFFNFLTSTKASFIYKQNGVYDEFRKYLSSKSNPIPINANFELQNFKVVIFPDSRKKSKCIDIKTLNRIYAILEDKNISYITATFASNNIQDSEADKQNIVYSNFSHLIDIIKNANFIISSDSLPVHIAELLKKPHWILYNKQINANWLTPSAQESKFYSKFEELNSMKAIFN